MHFLSLLKVETKRIFCSKITYLFIALCTLAPIFGYSLYTVISPSTKTAIYIGNPILASAIIGSVLFAIITLYELSKVDKNEISSLTNSLISPLTMSICKTLALIFVATLTTIIIMMTQLPYVVIKTDEFFRLNDFLTLSIWGLCTNLCFGVIIASAFYHFFKRVDLSFISFILLLILSHSQFIRDDFILRWANPSIRLLSDVFGNAHIFRMVIYSKIFWILIFGGMWILSILSIRRYGKGLFKSFLRNGNNHIAALLLSIVMIGSALAMYVYQPFIDHSGLDWTEMQTYLDDYEKNNNVVLYSQTGDVHFDTKHGTQFSKATYAIENITDEEQPILLSINPGFKIKSATLNNIDLAYTDFNNDKGGYKIIEIKIPEKQKGYLIIHYQGYQQDPNFFKSIYGRNYISDEYINPGISTHLIPPLFIARDKDTKSLASSVTMTLPEHMSLVTADDPPKVISENYDGTKTWHLTSYWLTYAADFAVHTFKYDEMELEFYFGSRYEEMMRGSGTIEIIDATLDYCINAYGPIKLKEDTPFRLIQGTEHEGGGGAWEGMSVALESAYVEENLDNPLKGANAAEIIAHEIIHQWWGILFVFSAGEWAFSGQDSLDTTDEEEWSAEGMTVYTSYRLMKQLKGEEYAQKHYVEVWKEAYKNLQRSFYYQNPEYLDILPEKYSLNILHEVESIEWYSVMPLKLLKAEQLLRGEEAFDKAIMNIFAPKAGTHEPVSYEEFLTGIGLTREDLSLD